MHTHRKPHHHEHAATQVAAPTAAAVLPSVTLSGQKLVIDSAGGIVSYDAITLEAGASIEISVSCVFSCNSLTKIPAAGGAAPEYDIVMLARPGTSGCKPDKAADGSKGGDGASGQCNGWSISQYCRGGGDGAAGSAGAAPDNGGNGANGPTVTLNLGVVSGSVAIGNYGGNGGNGGDGGDGGDGGRGGDGGNGKMCGGMKINGCNGGRGGDGGAGHDGGNGGNGGNPGLVEVSYVAADGASGVVGRCITGQKGRKGAPGNGGSGGAGGAGGNDGGSNGSPGNNGATPNSTAKDGEPGTGSSSLVINGNLMPVG
jgi:hypothetical protein